MHDQDKISLNLLTSRYLRGRNAYSRHNVLVQDVDLGALAERNLLDLGEEVVDRFIDRFEAFLPDDPIPGVFDSEFLGSLESGKGLNFGDVILQAILCVESAARTVMRHAPEIGFAAVMNDTPRHVSLIWETQAAWRSRESVYVARLGILDLLPPHLRPDLTEAFDTKLAELLDKAKSRRLSVTAACIKIAADERGLPFERITSRDIRIGTGKRQHRLHGPMTDTTSVTAIKLCADRRRSLRRLRRLKLPVPEMVAVHTEKEARDAVARLGVPSVIKNISGGSGRASLVINREDDAAEAFRKISEGATRIVVEPFVNGDHYRLLVIGGRVVAAQRRDAPSVTGDGTKTVCELINDLNEKILSHGYRFAKLNVDDEVRHLLKEADLRLDSVPEKGRQVVLRSRPILRDGALMTDVTDEVHPDNKELAERAAESIGLAVAGVDYVTNDVCASHRVSGGMIVNVISRPDLSTHVWPHYGRSRDVGGALLDALYPRKSSSRIPIFAIVGDRGTGRIAREVESILRASGQRPGLVLRDHTFLDGEHVVMNTANRFATGHALLGDMHTGQLVTSVSLRRAFRRGLQFDQCDAAAILPQRRPARQDHYRKGMDILKAANTGHFLIMSGDSIAMKELEDIDPARIVMIASSDEDDLARAHVENGHSAVMLTYEGGRSELSLFTGGKLKVTVDTNSAAEPVPHERLSRLQAKMFALGIAGLAKLNPATIRRGFQEARVVRLPSSRINLLKA